MNPCKEAKFWCLKIGKINLPESEKYKARVGNDRDNLTPA